MRYIEPLPFEPEPTEAQREADTLRYIPEISQETVAEMLSRITPLVRRSGVLCEYAPAEPRNPFTHCFTWDSGCETKPIDCAGLQLLDAVVTYHHCQYHGCVKPRVFEVLAQIPEHLRLAVTAFEVRVDDGVVECVDHPGLYGHKTITLLYRKP